MRRGRKYVADMPTPRDRARVAIEADVSVRTVDRIYNGKDTLITTFRRVEAAAVKLGVEPPVEPEVDAEACS